MKEIWKDIKGYENLYKISNYGNIVSYRGNIIKQRLASNGYFRVWLYNNINKTHKPLTVSRIVAESFIPNLKNKPFVNHINGVKTDNYSSNLEWCTQSENQLHAFNIGLQIGNIGENNGSAKLKTDQVLEIRKKKTNNKISNKNLALEYNVSRKTIDRIINNQIWKFI